MKRIKKKHLVRILRVGTIFSIMLILGNIIAILTGGHTSYALEDKVFGEVGLVGKGLSGIAAILAFFLKFIVWFLAEAIYAVIQAIMGEKGALEAILFSGGNDFPIIAVDFFNFNPSGNTSEAAKTFREAVAGWYYIIRLISIAALLLILIYVGIRMALSTVAADQTKYKKMLVDWATSMALVFLLHYIIVITITINTSLISTLDDLRDTGYDVSGSSPGSYFITAMRDNIKGFTDNVQGLFCAILLAIFMGETIMFLVYYIKRMVTVGFLIMISPLISITYSLDKMGDGKSQALNTWLKEFIFNILIQPFHCILYLAFFGSVASIMADENKTGIMGYILAIVITMFIYRAEGIIKQIFGFKANSVGSISETGQSVMNATGTFTKGAATVGAGAIALGRNVGGMVSGAKKGIGGIRDRKAMQNHLGNMSAEKRKAVGFSGDVNDKDAVNKFMKTEQGMAEFKKTERYKSKAKSKSFQRAQHKERAVKKATQKDMENQAYTYTDENGEKQENVSYGEMKRRADAGDKTAKAVLKNQEAKSRAKAEKEYRPPEVKGVRGTARKVGNAVSKFRNSDFGKSTEKVVRGLATAGFTITGAAVGAGFAGQMNDAITGGQIGHGLYKGIDEQIFERTTNNAAQGTGNVMDKMGWDKDNAEEKAKNVYTKGETGELSKEMEKSSDKLEKGLMESGLDNSTIEEIKNSIRLMMKDDKQGTVDIEAILKHFAPNMSEDMMKEQMKNANAFKNAVGEQIVYSEIKNQEGLGMDHMDYIEKAVKKMTNVDSTTNVYNQTLNQEIHEESTTNVDQTINVEDDNSGSTTRAESQGRRQAEEANRRAAGENEQKAEKDADDAEKEAEAHFNGK